MAAESLVVHCPRCRRDMKAHCARLCAWYACSNKACPVERFDMRRGLVLTVDAGVTKA